MLTKRNSRSWVFWTFWFWDEYANTMNTTQWILQWILQSVCQHNEYYNQYMDVSLVHWWHLILPSCWHGFDSFLKWPVTTWVQHGWHVVDSLGVKKNTKKNTEARHLGLAALLCPQVEVASINTGCTIRMPPCPGGFLCNRAAKMSLSQLDELKLTHRLRLKNTSFENTKSISMIHDLPVRSQVLLLRLGLQSATVQQYVVRRRPHLASMMSSSSLTNQLGRFPSAMGRPSFPAFKTYGGGLVVLTAFVVGSPNTPPAWPTVQQHQHGCCTKLAPLAMSWKLSPYACLCTLAVFL